MGLKLIIFAIINVLFAFVFIAINQTYVTNCEQLFGTFVAQIVLTMLVYKILYWKGY